ncbi:hypothetical protein BKP45_20630 [Anaerobacillus alkalidiazotrophicus]|uniref:Uncharacterized protein n=1 Tax=Anaerobacillus alkalidiazotrophicus TaxID=472963 RepID=A0A1S2M0D6_9BACI|nr:hypothetical protein [Anaerobacillus alkalidiazotrophicus]OIJ17963.1 hypothetical protein BKP45_20630 [Anaerobacillus alkalidiazotrophicus]
MSKFLKTMLFWVLIFPILATAISILISYFRGAPIEASSYLSNLLGFAVGGIVIGFVMYNVQKLKEEK